MNGALEIDNLNIDNFREDIQSSDLCNPSAFMQISSDQAVELYNSTLKSIFGKHCPTKDKIYRSNHTKSKWFNGDLQRMKRNRRQAQRRFEKHPTVQKLITNCSKKLETNTRQRQIEIH